MMEGGDEEGCRALTHFLETKYQVLDYFVNKLNADLLTPGFNLGIQKTFLN